MAEKERTHNFVTSFLGFLSDLLCWPQKYQIKYKKPSITGLLGH